nr:MAG TPA_asm: hypothetical protein [Bacteriophage sp.]
MVLYIYQDLNLYYLNCRLVVQVSMILIPMMLDQLNLM